MFSTVLRWMSLAVALVALVGVLKLTMQSGGLANNALLEIIPSKSEPDQRQTLLFCFIGQHNASLAKKWAGKYPEISEFNTADFARYVISYSGVTISVNSAVLLKEYFQEGCSQFRRLD